MKKTVLFLGLFFGAYILIAQGDLQWLAIEKIVSGASVTMGKEGTSGSLESMTNNYSNLIDVNNFMLKGISHPDIGYYAYTQNDVFMIFADGTHFNTRQKPAVSDPGLFYNASAAAAGAIDHHFISAYGSPMRFLYLTNIYEGDDWPPTVRVQAGGGGSGIVDYTITATTTPANALTASHDVVRYKDFTIILDKAKINAEAAAKGFPSLAKYYIEYGSIVPIDPPGSEGPPPTVDYSASYFEISPIFPTMAGGSLMNVPWYPTTSGSHNGGKLWINNDTYNYAYVNLTPTTVLADAGCYPGVSGAPRYQAVFNIREPGGTMISTITEDIRDSHDPNFIRIDSIGKDRSGDYVVYYHLEFENTSLTSPFSIYVTFELPELAENDCFEVTKWFCGGFEKMGKVDVIKAHSSGTDAAFKGTKGSDDLMVKCTFIGSIDIACPVPDKTKCTGYIEFKVKFDKDVKVPNPAVNIWVKDPIVYFDDVPTRIKLFFDYKKAKYTYQQMKANYSRPIKPRAIHNVTCKSH